MFTTTAVEDVKVFLARVRRLDTEALLRLRPGKTDETIELWTVLPFGVLATTTVFGELSGDITVRAADLDVELPDDRLPTRYDTQWRGALPTDGGVVVESVTADECRGLGEAAATTLDQTRGRGVGDRRLRDALLDHVALRVIDTAAKEHEIHLRLVVGLLRMGFAPHGAVRIRLASGRLGLQGLAGTVWNPAAGLSLL